MPKYFSIFMPLCALLLLTGCYTLSEIGTLPSNAKFVKTFSANCASNTQLGVIGDEQYPTQQSHSDLSYIDAGQTKFYRVENVLRGAQPVQTYCVGVSQSGASHNWQCPTDTRLVRVTRNVSGQTKYTVHCYADANLTGTEDVSAITSLSRTKDERKECAQTAASVIEVDRGVLPLDNGQTRVIQIPTQANRGTQWKCGTQVQSSRFQCPDGSTALAAKDSANGVYMECFQ